MIDWIKDFKKFLRLSKDKYSQTFSKAPIWLIVSINSERGRLKKRLFKGSL